MLTPQYNCSYTVVMKTAISIPDNVFESAERLARHLGKSRSELYTQAITNYLEKSDDRVVKELLDKAYLHNDSQLDSSISDLQARSITREKW